jgi:hypothetical protein
MPSPKRGY